MEDSVEMTNITPLWARATYYEKNIKLIDDPMSKVIFNKILETYHLEPQIFINFYGNNAEFFGLNFISRAYCFGSMRELMNFL